MAQKNDLGIAQGGQKLVAKPVKTQEELAVEEYCHQLELAVENH